VRILVKHNANVNHLDRSSMTVIHKAVIHDRPECVQELMEAKADPNVIYMGDTPLSIASRHNRERICKILLNYREVNINHRNDQGGTPLHFACAAIVDSPVCVDMLVKCGAKVNVQDHKKNTPAMVASFFNKPKILQYLIEQEADLSVKNNEDKDAYDVANEKEHYECKSIIGRYLEKRSSGVYRKPSTAVGSSSSSQLDNEFMKNFDTKNRIR
jgi:ankyrin repeat protein